MRVSVGDFRLGEDECDAIAKVLKNGRISEGRYVREFEENFARYVGTKYCVATSSGTGALICGLTAIIHDSRFPNVKKGSSVIVSPVTYISTVNAIVLCGLNPIFVDIDPHTFVLIPDEVERFFKENKNVSMILPVHLMGYPNDMDRLNDIASKYGAVVFEDSAQAHGSLYKGRKTGTFSLMSDFSFYVAHNIQAGEMGALVTNDEILSKLCRRIKANGRLCDCKKCTRPEGYCPYQDEEFDPRFTHDIICYNFKTMEFQAALAISQLKRAEWIFEQRQHNVKYLNDKLNRYSNQLSLPLYSPDVSYLAYPIIIKSENISRTDLMRRLEKRGVETRPLFGSIPTMQPAYSYLASDYAGKLPNAEYVGRLGFYIGCHQYLKDKELDYVADVFGEVLDG